MTLGIGNAFVAPEKQLSLKSAGHDFLAFYTAGTFVREGRTADLYDLDQVRAYQHSLAGKHELELGDSVAPWWNPPFYALAFVPFSLLSYPAAWFAWMALNVLAAGLACLLLCRMLPAGCGWRTWGLVPLLLFTSLPLIQALGHGQNTAISLLLLAATVTLWRSDRALPAGIVLGLLFYKPQLAAVLAVVLVVTLGRRALIGVAITGTTLLVINLCGLPDTLNDFLTRVPPNLHYIQTERAYVWDRHVTFTGFWRLIVQGHSIGDTLSLATVLAAGSSLLIGGLLLWALVRNRKRPSHDAVIAATIVATPLLMPFYFDYDLLLLAVPAVLLARTRAAPEDVATRTTDRAQMIAWVALYGWLFVNPPVASYMRVNGAVVIVTALAVMALISIIRRAVPLTLTDADRPEMNEPVSSRPLAA